MLPYNVQDAKLPFSKLAALRAIPKAGISQELSSMNPLKVLRDNVLPGEYNYPACALRAVGQLLSDGAPAVGWGRTFCRVGG